MEKQVRVGTGVIILNKNNEVLLGHRSATKEDTGGIIGRDTWSLPGGKQEYDEQIVNCFIRETKEECDLDIINPQIIAAFDDFGPDRHFVTILGFTTEYTGDPKVMERNKEDEWKWFDVENLPKNLYGPSEHCLKYFNKKFCHGVENNLKNRFGKNFYLLKEMPDYERAEKIVQVMFAGKTDKEGQPYINHLYYVSGEQKSIDGQVVGLLHDLLEDTASTEHELRELGFNQNIIDALKLVTKPNGMGYMEYVDRVLDSNNETAIYVKEADMRNNSDPERIARIPDEKLREKLTKKYAEPYKKILDKIGEIENDRYQTNKRK